MKKYYIQVFFVIAIILFSTTLNAQYTQQLTTAKQQANLLAEAIVKKDYKTIIKFTNPNIKAKAGGDLKMLKSLEDANKMIATQGITIKSVTIGNILSILKNKGEFLCTFPQTSEMKMQVGKVIVQSTIIGSSSDNGNNWTFVDNTGKDKAELKKIIANFSDKLVIAGKKEPQFLPN